MEDRLDPAGLEQVRDRRRQLDRAAGERPVRDDRRVEVALESAGADAPKSGRTNGASAGPGSRVATPTTRAVLRLCSGSGVSESQSRTSGWANGSSPAGRPTGDRRSAAPTSPSLSPASTTPTTPPPAWSRQASAIWLRGTEALPGSPFASKRTTAARSTGNASP